MQTTLIKTAVCAHRLCLSPSLFFLCHAHTCTYSAALCVPFVLDLSRFLPHTLLPELEECFWVDCSTLTVQRILFSHRICGRGIKIPPTLFPTTSTSRLCFFFISFFIPFFFSKTPKALLSILPYISCFVLALSGGLCRDAPMGEAGLAWCAPNVSWLARLSERVYMQMQEVFVFPCSFWQIPPLTED